MDVTDPKPGSTILHFVKRSGKEMPVRSFISGEIMRTGKASAEIMQKLISGWNLPLPGMSPIEKCGQTLS